LSVDFGRYDKSDESADPKPLPTKDCLGEGALPAMQDPFFIFPQALATEYPGQGFIGNDYRLMGHLLPSVGGQMTPNCKLSLTRFVQKLQSLGFKELFIDTAPSGGNKDTGVVGNAPGSFPDYWLPAPPGGTPVTLPRCDMSGYPPDAQLLNQQPSVPPSPVDYFN